MPANTVWYLKSSLRLNCTGAMPRSEVEADQLAVPRSMYLYSILADQLDQNFCSSPAPAVQPTRVSENWPKAVAEKGPAASATFPLAWICPKATPPVAYKSVVGVTR